MTLENRHAAEAPRTLAHAVADPGGARSRGAEGVEPDEETGLAGEPDELFVSAAVVSDVLARASEPTVHCAGRSDGRYNMESASSTMADWVKVDVVLTQETRNWP